MPRDHATPLSLVPGDRPVDGTATDPAEVALLTARPSADAAQTPGDAESSAWQDPAAEAGPTLPQGWWHGYGAADLFADLDRWTADEGAAGRGAASIHYAVSPLATTGFAGAGLAVAGRGTTGSIEALLGGGGGAAGGGPGGDDPGDGGAPDGSPPGPAPDDPNGGPGAGPDGGPSPDGGPGSDGDGGNWFDDLLNSAGDAVRDLWDSFSDSVLDPVGDAWDTATDWANDAYNSAADAVNDAISDLGDYASDAADAIRDGWNDLSDRVADAAQNAADAISDTFNDAVDWTNSAGEAVGDALGDMYDTAADALGDALDWASDTAGDFMDWAGDTLDQIGDAVGSAADSAIAAARDALAAAGDTLGDFASDFGDALSRKLAEFGTAAGAIPTTFSAAVGAAYDALTEVVGSNSLAGRIVKGHGTVLSNLYTALDAVNKNTGVGYAEAAGSILGGMAGTALAAAAITAIGLSPVGVVAIGAGLAASVIGGTLGASLGAGLWNTLFGDPLVIDLDGDGVEVTNRGNNPVTFDIDADGFAETTGWVGADDGLLALDRDGNGTIDDATELFSDKAGGRSGFASLALLDQNGDGRIDATDAAYADLRIWQDADGDGITDAGELAGLADHGIVSIGLASVAAYAGRNGNVMLTEAEVTLTGGQTRTIAEVALGYDGLGTRAVDQGTGDIVREYETGRLLQEMDPAQAATAVAAAGTAVLIGTGFDDQLSAGSDGAWLDGAGGDDVLAGGGGNDVLVGGAGTDDMNGGDGDDVLFIDAADLAGGTVTGGQGFDSLVVQGTSGITVDLADHAAERFVGNAGIDIVTQSGSAAVSLYGAGGDDQLSGGDADDVLMGQAGNDTLSGGDGLDAAVFTGRRADYQITTAGGVTTVTDLRTGAVNEGADSLTGIERLVFQDGAVHLDGTNANPFARTDRVSQSRGDGFIDLPASRLTANDLDGDGDALAITGIGDVTGGSAWLTEDGHVRFVAAPGFEGLASFTYTVDDGHGGTATGLVEVEVEARGPRDGLAPYQWHLVETTVTDVWPDYTGEGVVIGIADNGVDYTHPDVAPNYDDTIDWDYSSNDDVAMPHASGDAHGTYVAAIAAGALNGEGVIGVAYEATLAGYLTFEGYIDSWADYPNGSRPRYDVDVLNNSWTFNSDFATTLGFLPASWTTPGMEKLAVYGRDGLGTNIVFAAGNTGDEGSRADYDLFVNSRYTIAVASVDYQGDQSVFSRPGAAVLIGAPGSGIVSADRPGSTGYDPGEFGADYHLGSGTSAAAPVVSGAIALMLEANADLGWRDVQAILANSAWREMPADADAGWRFNGATSWNGGGFAFRDDTGFGYLDARAAVRLAETWTLQSTSANEVSVTLQNATDVTLADNGSITSTIEVTDEIEIGHVTLSIDLTHTHVGDLVITLTSPDGTVSTFVDRAGKVAGDDTDIGTTKDNLNFSFSSVQFRGELSPGTWTLTVTDARTGDTGVLRDWKLGIHGDTPSDDTLTVLTDQFADLVPAGQDGRLVIEDDAGHDTINAAIVTSDIAFDLAAGGVVDGREVVIADGTVIEDFFAGDGDDLLVGNAADNRLWGGRGDDVIEGGAGADVIEGGQGIDTAGWSTATQGITVDLAAGTASDGDTLSGIENLVGSDHDDTLTGNDGANLLVGGAGGDTLDGGAGDDTLAGGAGDDVIQGGDGDDMIEVGTGADTVDGGDGWDTLIIDGDIADYTLAQSGPGWTLTGAGVAVSFQNIDLIAFADGDLTVGTADAAPVAVADALSVEQGDVLVIDPATLLANDTDTGGTQLTITGVGEAQGGAVAMGADGLIRFRPADGFTGTAGFTYRLSDGRNRDVTGQVTVAVAAGATALILGTTGHDRMIGTGLDEKLIGGLGVDNIQGGGGNDVLAGGEQNDRLAGGSGDDSYVMNRGDGVDWIDDGIGHDVLDLRTGFTPQAVTVRTVVNSYDADGNTLYGAEAATGTDIADLYLELGDGDWIILHDFFGATGYTVDEVRFADGTIWTAAQLIGAGLVSTDGDDVLVGGQDDETIAGGLGNDWISGGGGDDVYVYARGDGVDLIDNTPGNAAGDTDELSFTDVDAADAGFALDGTDLVISVDGVEAVRVRDFIGAGNLDLVRFADGTLMDDHAIRMALLGGTTGADTLTGTSGADILAGGLGDDVLTGANGNDTYIIAAGDGNDRIVDTYGSTGDVLILNDVDPAILGFLRPTADLDDLILVLDGGREVFLDEQAANTTYGIDRVIFETASWSRTQLENQAMAWAISAGDDVVYGFASDNLIDGGAGNDDLSGRAGDDTLIGGTGDDTLRGGTGADTYRFGADDGADLIVEELYNSAQDRIVFASGLVAGDLVMTRSTSDLDDLTLSFAGHTGTITIDEQFASTTAGVESIAFGDGISWTKNQIIDAYIAGVTTSGDDVTRGTGYRGDVFAGSAGNDTIYGYGGADTYNWGIGHGDDVIYEDLYDSSTDSLVFGAGLLAADILLTRGTSDIDDLTVSFAGQTGSVFLDEQFASTRTGVERFVFDDGTVWTKDQIVDAYIASVTTSGDDVTRGTGYRGDVFAGSAGNDTIYGYGGADTYNWGIGHGDDVIYEDLYDSSTDSLVFGAGLLAADILLTRGTSDIDDLTVSFAGQTGSVFLDEQFASTRTGVERFVFDDGTVWTKDQIVDAYIASVTTSGDDITRGVDYRGDVFAGSAGNDTIYGDGGADTYNWGIGHGDDVIYEDIYDSSTDSLVFGAGLLAPDITLSRTAADIDDLIVSFAGQAGSIFLDEQFVSTRGGVERFVFDDGTIWSRTEMKLAYLSRAGTTGNDDIWGFDDSADTLSGGQGDDFMNGLGGADTYLYDAGDGNDRIYDYGSSSQIDTLQLGAGITADDVDFRRSLTDSDDVTLSFDGGGAILLDEQMSSSSYYGIERMVFADGTIWTMSSVEGRIRRGGNGNDTITGGTDRDWITGEGGNDTLDGGAGDDRIHGDAGQDRITGGAGDDILSGGDGSDSFVIAAGAGATRIRDFVAGAGTDDLIELVGLSGFTSFAEVLAAATDGADGVDIDLGSGGQLVLEGVLKSALHQDDFAFL
jgi:Ca2+-binding RTX toxin-like protein